MKTIYDSVQPHSTSGWLSTTLFDASLKAVVFAVNTPLPLNARCFVLNFELSIYSFLGKMECHANTVNFNFDSLFYNMSFIINYPTRHLANSSSCTDVIANRKSRYFHKCRRILYPLRIECNADA